MRTPSSKRSSLFVLALALGSSAWLACSLFVSIPDSLTDAHGVGADAAGARDDSGAQVGGDAGDAGTGADSSGVDLCGSALFCDDFDHGSPLDRWDRILTEPGIETRLDSTFASSAPNALLARIDKGVAEDCAYAGLEKRLAGSFTSSTVSVSLRAEGPDSLRKEGLAVTDITGSSGACAILVVLRWETADYAVDLLEQVLKGGQSVITSVHETSARVGKQSWQRITVAVDYRTNELRIDANGTNAGRFTLEHDCPFTPGTAGLRVGMHCSEQQAMTREMHADDVAFDAR